MPEEAGGHRTCSVEPATLYHISPDKVILHARVGQTVEDATRETHLSLVKNTFLSPLCSFLLSH